MREAIGREGEVTEFLLMGLRLAEGIDLKRYQVLSGKHIEPLKVDALREMGMVSVENQRLKATTKGRMVLNSVISELLPE